MDTQRVKRQESVLLRKTKKKILQYLSFQKEQRSKNYKYLGMSLKLYFPNITNIFEHFRNNNL